MTCIPRDVLHLLIEAASFRVRHACPIVASKFLLAVTWLAAEAFLISPSLAQDRASVRELSDTEALSVLDELATIAANNYSKLVTLRAEYNIEDRVILREEMLKKLQYEVPAAPGPWERSDTGVVTVRFDAVKDSIFTEIQMKQSILSKDAHGNTMDHKLPVTTPERAIVTPSHFYYFRFDEQYGDFREVPAMQGQIGRVAFRDPVEEADRRRHASVVDPRDFFGYAGVLWADHLRMIAELLRKERDGTVGKPEGAPDRVISVRSIGEAEGHVYRVAFTMWKSIAGAGSGGARFELRFPKTSGYLCGSSGGSLENAGYFQMAGWEYKDVEGVKIPSKIVRTAMNPKDGSVTNNRVLVLKACQVNDGLRDADIGLEALGLKDGERLLDRVEEVCYKYRGGRLINAVSFHARAEDDSATLRPPDPSRANLKALLVGNILFLTVVAAVLLWRHRRATR